MRVGVMLRHLDEHGGGVRHYTEKLLTELAANDSHHEFYLLYSSGRHIGRFEDVPHFHEAVYRSRHKLLWDQIAVRRASRIHRCDVIFNPKYSVPLSSPVPSVFVCHGLDWYVMPEASKWIDRLSHRYLIPQYTKSAQRIIAVSETTKAHLLDFLPVDPSRIDVVYHGVDHAFFERWQSSRLSALAAKYGLPERFVLYVGQIYPPKNFARLLRAYAAEGPRRGYHLVVAGEHRWLCEDDLSLISELQLEQWVTQTGWVGHDELPGFYQLAAGLLLPSLYESFGLPILEAMASRCPVVTSARYGTKEIADDAACLVDPESVPSIANGLAEILDDPETRERLIERGLARARKFTWTMCAEQTIRAVEMAVEDKKA